MVTKKLMTEMLLWDNDGVLVETEPLFFQANAEVLADLGIEYSLSQFRNISLLQGKSALNLAKARGLSDSDILALRETRDARYAELLRGKDLALPGVRDVLHELSNQYRMAVVTSSRATHFEIIHEHSKLLPYFEFVLTVDNVTQTKPHPEPYLCALDKAQLSASAGIAIEDSPRGVTSAKAAGLRCVAVHSELTAASSLAHADVVINRIMDLPVAIVGID